MEKQTHVQKINYNTEQEKITKAYRLKGIRPKVIVHSCCAPCSTYVLEKLVVDMDVTIYFYNPNIHPKQEYLRRMDAQKAFIDAFNHKTSANVEFLPARYEPKEFYAKTKDLADEKEGSGTRCAVCYELRIDQAAQKGAELSYDFFASALTLSPKKNSQKINEIGKQLEEIYDIAYLPSDFKKNNGYKRSIELCGEYDVYRQCYCGCVFAAKQQGIDFKEVIAKAKQAQMEKQAQMDEK
ncbi:MAG: epoxyqueuosine reductase QueH [Culicoidibacterales bacterium]